MKQTENKMKVANVEVKVKTITKQVTVGTEIRVAREFQTTFEEVRGYSNFAVKGNMLIFYNAGKIGDHVSYNQERVVGFTTHTE
jgi:hypothetical protein